jgi:hypothetical protein
MAEVAPGSSAPEMGVVARLTGVLFSPGKTFESIARKPGWDWLVPVALLIGLTVIGGIFINPKLDTETAMKDTMKRIEARGNMSDAQREQIEKTVEKQYAFVKTGWGRFLGPPVILLVLFFVPAVYLGIAKAMGVSARYGTILAGYGYCQVPQFIKGIIGVAVAWPRESIDLNDVDHLVKSNVGAFLDAESVGKPLMALMNSVDLFEIWGLVLGSIMLARTTKFSKNGATITVVSVWVLYILMKFGGALLGSAFGG